MTRRSTRALPMVMLAAALLASAACDGLPETSTPETYTVTALYEMRQTIPFPSDVFTVEDAAPPSGVRVNLERTHTDMVDYAFAAEILRQDDLIEAINSLDGFSTLPPILVGLSGELDLTTLPATPAAATEEDSWPCCSSAARCRPTWIAPTG